MSGICQDPRPDCLAAAKQTAIIFRRLMEYYSPDEADTWLNEPHPQLQGKTPVNVIASERGEDVGAIIDRLDGDGYL